MINFEKVTKDRSCFDLKDDNAYRVMSLFLSEVKGKPFNRPEINEAKKVVRSLRKEEINHFYFSEDFLINLEKNKDPDQDHMISLPFKTCFFTTTCPYLFYISDPEKNFSLIRSVMLHEITPSKILIVGTELKTDLTGMFSPNISCWFLDFNNREEMEDFDGESDSISSIIKAMKSARWGEESCNKRVVNRKTLKTNVIKKIVHIDTKKGSILKKKVSSVYGGKINWSHRWEVRGHWRRVKYIGKDRSGNYLIPGHTWVTPCIKGKGELVKKTRLVR